GHPGNPFDRDDEGVFISKINPEGAAARDGRLKVGTRIIEVNGISLLGATHQEAVHSLRTAGDTIALLLCDGYDTADLPGQNGNNKLETPTSPSLRSFASSARSVSSIDKDDD